MHRFLARGLVAVVLAVVTLAASVATVRACSCMEFTLEGAIAAADIAFVGVLTDPKTAPERGGFEPITWRFEMERANRAVNGSIIEVSAPANDGANCGVGFGVDERWLVMASRFDGVLSSSSCAGNLPMDDADPLVVAQIEDSVPAIAAAPAAEPSPSPPSALLPIPTVERAGSSGWASLPAIAIAVGAFAVLIATTAFFMVRRARQS